MSSVLVALVCACSANNDENVSMEIGTARQALFEDDEENCGAEGYQCVGGRECVDSRCTPAWIGMDTTDSPSARGFAGAGLLEGNYVVMGGCTESGDAQSDAYSYDLANDTWGSAPSLGTPLVQFSAITTGSGIQTFGGLTQCFNGTAIGPHMLSLGSLSGSWDQIEESTAPTGRYNAPFEFVNGQYVVFGGSDDMFPYVSTGGLLDPGNPPWTDPGCSLLDCGRGGPSVAFGYDNKFFLLNDIGNLFYDTVEQTWDNWIVPELTPSANSLNNGNHIRYASDSDRVYTLSGSGSVIIFDKATMAVSSDTATQPSGLCSEAAVVWTGAEMVAWGGWCDAPSSVGGRYQPPAAGL